MHKNDSSGLMLAEVFLFDCDGVILNSNKIKSNAFRMLANRWGRVVGDKLLNFIAAEKGKSRNEIFKHLVHEILPCEGYSYSLKESDEIASQLIEQFSCQMRKQLKDCELAEGLIELRKYYSDKRWFILSAGLESEIKDVFKQRNILNLFDGGVYGSPRSKQEIINFLYENEVIKNPCILIGDSKADYLTAQFNNMQFIFVSDWTDQHDWENFTRHNKIYAVNKISNLMPCF